MKLELISTDFDGTIYDEFSAEPIPGSLQRYLAGFQAGGGTWAINTGRDLASVLEAMGRVGIEVYPDFIVAVEREIYRHAGHRYEAVQPWNAMCDADHRSVFGAARAAIAALMTRLDEEHDATFYSDAWSPLCVIGRTPAQLERLAVEIGEACSPWPDLAVVRNDVYARLCHRKYDKGTALSEIRRLRGIRLEATFAVGDHFNDLPMLELEHAGHLGTLANGQEAVKRQVRERGGRIASRPAGWGVLELLETRWG